ncbi:MAG: cobalt-precorrin 5A hydrolase [Acidaminococcaceae bacterium]|nr:cobalt-precorrin 5A hydrolase [Acidaminococcaceae bacterium]
MRTAVYSFSLRGAQLSKKVGELLESLGYEVRVQTLPKYAEEAKLPAMAGNHNEVTEAAFKDCQAIVFVGSVGIAVRSIAPFLKSKLLDPAVVSVDERGKFIIPLIAGHIGGANELARVLAAHLGGQACVTTATDVNGLFAVDEWAARNRMVICSLKAAKDFAAALVHDDVVGLYSDFPVTKPLPRNIELTSEKGKYLVGMAVTLDKMAQPFLTTVRLLPKIVHLGIGCRRNTPLENIEALVLPQLERLKIDKRCVVSIASVDLKQDEAGLLAFAEKYKWRSQFYSADALSRVEGNFTPSDFVKSVVGVSNVCERSAVKASGGGRLLLPKTSLDGVTLAIAVEDITLDLNKTGLKTE